MKKKLVSALLISTMAVTAFVGCGNKAATTEEAPVEEAAAEEEAFDYGSGEIKLWVADAVVDFTKEQAEKFVAEKGIDYTITVEAVGEGDAAKNVLTDVEGSADIYGFAQDQAARLVSAGALQQLTGTGFDEWIAANNDAGSASAAKVGDTTYAFPITSDNGYFLYYDKSVVTDPSTLEGIAEQCEAAGKNFYFEVNSGWYQTAFFFATGCDLSYDIDAEGNFASANVTYASEQGVVALQEIAELVAQKSFQSGSSLSTATNVGAIVDGTWDATSAKEIFGDNYACAKLPTFTGTDGNSYQLSGFGGFKLLGVKPQTEAGKLRACLELAQYLTSEEVQVARYEANGWGPSNVAAQSNAAVQADEALSALGEQLAFAVPQGQYPDDYWSLATALGDDVIGGKITASTSADDMMAALQAFQDTCISYAK